MNREMGVGSDIKRWLDKAEPKYAPTNRLWRVRIMRKGFKFNKWMKTGNGDPSSTGELLARAEWEQVKRQIITTGMGVNVQLGVQADGTYKVLSDDMFDAEGNVNDGRYVETYRTRDEYNRSLRRQVYRDEFESSPFRDQMTLDEYLDWLDFKEQRRTPCLNEPRSASPGNLPVGRIPFKLLIAAFKASLQMVYEATVAGDDDEDESMGKSRLEQYGYALAHMEKLVGDVLCDPVGMYRITELQLEQVLETYRNKCRKEYAEHKRKKLRGRGKHWFNERMKAARKLTTFLTTKRLCNGLPAGIEVVTRKKGVKSRAMAIPLPVLRAIWAVAEDEFKTYMLLALNLGFRQTEISLLNWDEQHVTVEAGKVIVDKDRGKTGVPIKIPLWSITETYVRKHAHSTGPFFTFDGKAEKAAIECIGKRWNKLRRRVARTLPEAKAYNFENLRDTGASYVRSRNPFLVPLYLGQTTKGDAAMYIAEIKDEMGKVMVPMFMDKVLDDFLVYLNLPMSAE